jgi:hypothetical protein
MACRCEILKLARVFQAMAASLGLLQALKSLFLDHRRLFHNVEERLCRREISRGGGVRQGPLPN